MSRSCTIINSCFVLLFMHKRLWLLRWRWQYPLQSMPAIFLLMGSGTSQFLCVIYHLVIHLLHPLSCTKISSGQPPSLQQSRQSCHFAYPVLSRAREFFLFRFSKSHGNFIECLQVEITALCTLGQTDDLHKHFLSAGMALPT